jgi:hypothetical protein
VVSVNKEYYTAVYQCATEPTNKFCGMAGYEPGEGLYSDQAWTELGSCTGTLSPAQSPNFGVLKDLGGCTSEYEGSIPYKEGDHIAKDGFVYECKSWPASDHCSQAGYEPGTGTEGTEYWQDAWNVVGYCSGTISPTSSPSFESLELIGGCPDEWEARATVDAYEEGDRVSDGKLVFACKAWPMSGHCSQAGYEPNTNPATAGTWKDAWAVVGWCNGSIGPTASPSVDPAALLGACPEEWEGDAYKYEEGDIVSITVSEDPLRKVAFKCKAWPYSGHCGQFSPTNELGGRLGWALAGSCDGSVGHTSSPSFDKLREAGPCPEEWSKSKTDYEAGDLVSYAVSTSPERTLLYECRDFPNSGYCNQGEGFAPTSEYGSMAWVLKGSCSGSMSPTASPVVYSGTCQYKKCFEGLTCSKGSSGPAEGETHEGGIVTTPVDTCSCKAGDDECTKGTLKICTLQDVEPYSKAVTYDYGDEVRIGKTKLKCKGWPAGLWCNQDAYMPKKDAGIWHIAWTVAGQCPALLVRSLVLLYCTNYL